MRGAPPAWRIGLAQGLALVVLWLAANASVAHDGPYVLRDGEGWRVASVEQRPDGWRREMRKLDAGEAIVVPSVGDAPSFAVTPREPVPARESFDVPATAPLFVVADTHGEYEILVAQLRAHGIVDATLGWSFGRGHLVVLGDVFDRGPRQTEILWLLYKLEAEAASAGGGAHLVLGNHEVMVLRGDLRYLHARYADTARVLEVESYAELFGPSTLLGAWLRARPALLRVNDQLFVHGGVSRALADSGLAPGAINSRVRALLTDVAPRGDEERRLADLLLGSEGPLWYRGYFQGRESSPVDEADVRHVLAAFGVRRIVVGHTIVPTIAALYGGKVIAVQVYPRREDDGDVVFESLLVRDRELWRARPDGRRERLAFDEPLRRD